LLAINGSPTSGGYVSGSVMATVIESLWTSRPIYSVIAFMVWLSVCIHLMNQNAYPAHSEDVLAALPTRATRVIINGNHTAFLNT
jgi:type IV secretory pathway VirB3-like protein